MRIVHCSDLHLGRRLPPLPLLDRRCLETFRHASFVALKNLVDLCLAERAGLLLIAGDLVDAWDQNHQVGLRLVGELLRLEHSRTKVFWVRGNHDAESRIITTLLLPSHVRELGIDKVETVVVGELGVALHGRSYPRRATFDNLLAEYPDPIPDLLNVGLLHTSADGAAPDDGYAPCGRRELVRRGYQYFALGHLHTPERISERAAVVYSGCLQGRSFLESGPRGAMLVTAEGDSVISIEHRALDAVRFGVVRVDVGRPETLEAVADAVRGAINAASRTHHPRRLVVRLILEGLAGVSCLLSAGPTRRTEALLDAVRDPDGGVWVESVWGAVRSSPTVRVRLDERRGPWVRV
jgi:DNA repair protein SbcD/Mre11